MTYLELCQQFVQELGIAGGGSNNPTAVVGQTGELLRVTNWIREAALQIDNQCNVWRYLWSPFSESLPVGATALTMPSSPRAKNWLHDSFWLDRYGPNQRHLGWKSWKQYRRESSRNTQPLNVVERPDGSLILDGPMVGAWTLTGEYYRAPVALSSQDDVPAMPVEYHRAILCRAAVIYGGREDAPEIVAHYEPEYIEILENLKSDQMDERRQEGDANAYDYQDQVIPGFEYESDLYLR